MILLYLKLDNFMAFNDFEMSMTYPKKIVGNQMTECLKDHPNFRYRKLNILMGANASGKTSIGRMLLYILRFIARKGSDGITSSINDPGKDASFEIQFAAGDDFYRIAAIVKGGDESGQSSYPDLLIKVEQTVIGKNDTYEKVRQKLNAEADGGYSGDYIRKLEKIKELSWDFEFSGESLKQASGSTP